uniref:Uncharacterized protein n=1 Tax=Octopus bimaculoides TaxID=37653 RepID=A0A0L8GZ70_OCTBM
MPLSYHTLQPPTLLIPLLRLITLNYNREVVHLIPTSQLPNSSGLDPHHSIRPVAYLPLQNDHQLNPAGCLNCNNSLTSPTSISTANSKEISNITAGGVSTTKTCNCKNTLKCSLKRKEV